jgi:hypothetical protein
MRGRERILAGIPIVGAVKRVPIVVEARAGDDVVKIRLPSQLVDHNSALVPEARPAPGEGLGGLAEVAAIALRGDHSSCSTLPGNARRGTSARRCHGNGEFAWQ